MENYTTREGQTIFDLAIQLYGDVSQALTIVRNNDSIDSLNSNVPTGTVIQYEDPKNTITNQFRLRNTQVVTYNPALIPGAAFDDSFDNSFDS